MSEQCFKCPYCGHIISTACGKWRNHLFPMSLLSHGLRHDQHPHGCPIEPSGNGQCYTCGCTSTENPITTSQRNRYGSRARCTLCIRNLITDRHKIYTEKQPVDELLEAVSNADIDQVGTLLEKGVDPNGRCQLRTYDNISDRYVEVWNADGTPYLDTDEHQPNSPLKMVVFRISDCMLEEDDLLGFKSIAKLLIAAGADRKVAMDYAKARYGSSFIADFERNDCMFNQVLQEIHGDKHDYE
jgi:hypothetical protein